MIYEVEPLGAITIVDVKVGEQILKAQLLGQPKFSEGENVHLCFDLAKCHLSIAVQKGGLRLG